MRVLPHQGIDGVSGKQQILTMQMRVYQVGEMGFMQVSSLLVQVRGPGPLAPAQGNYRGI